MGSLFLSPPSDWSAVTLYEMRDHISARAADAPDRPACHWVRGSSELDDVDCDEATDFCRLCCAKKVCEILKKHPGANVSVDGGWSVEHDSPPYCEACGVTLDGTLTEYGIEREVEAQTSRAESLAPLDWSMLDLAMINVRGEDMTLAEYVAKPPPKDPLSAQIHATNVGIWERVAPVVIADMAQRGPAR